MEFKDWLEKIKTDKPELDTFITKIEKYFSSTGFDGLRFENAIMGGLKSIEADIEIHFKPNLNGNNQENNN